MNNKYPFFKYITGNSKVHKLNSKFKIAWFLLSLLISLLIYDYMSLLIFSAFLLYIILESKISINAYLSNIVLIWPLYLIIFIVSFLLSLDIFLSILLTSKFILIVILFLILTFTTSLSEIAWGFECLFIKLKKIKVPVSRISLRIALAIKFISTLFEQFKTIRKSMAYRGISYYDSKLKTFKNMFFPIINLSLKLSKRRIAAMKLRFYGSSKKRTNYHDNKVTNFDKLLIVFSIILIYITIWQGWLK